MPLEEPGFLELISRAIRDRTGVDLGAFRAATVKRRIDNRMIAVGVSSAGEYLDLLHHDEREASLLVERVTIKVSSLYRNPAVYDLLRQEVLPQLASQRAGRPLEIWSAGCAHGQEPFTLAMLLEEGALAGEVLATDVDPLAIAAAARGNVDAESLEDLPAALKERFVETDAAGAMAVAAAVRGRVRFEVQDLTQPLAPSMAGRFDLVCCRNVLIYLKRDVQETVLCNLRAALSADSFLCLGEAEWPSPEVLSTLAVADRPTRLFRASAEAPGEGHAP
jgi:chemotaxis protein methyltransferase CheR